MTTWFVTRHPGAVEWAKNQGIEVDECVSHFQPADVEQGDVVIGTLPVNLVAEVNRFGGRYLHLSISLPPEARGKELSADEMSRYHARLEEYKVTEEQDNGNSTKNI